MTKARLLSLMGYVVLAALAGVVCVSIVVVAGYYGLIVLVLLFTGHWFPAFGILGLLCAFIGAYYGYLLWKEEA